MYHSVAMGVLECEADFSRDPDRLVDREPALAFQPVAQRLALHERHDEPQVTLGLTRVEDGQDMGVLEAGGESDLTAESRRADRGRHVRVQNLDGHPAFVPRVVGEPNGGHPTAAELPEHAVRAKLAVGEVAHGFP
jgi:hypothetical protein